MTEEMRKLNEIINTPISEINIGPENNDYFDDLFETVKNRPNKKGINAYISSTGKKVLSFG